MKFLSNWPETSSQKIPFHEQKKNQNNFQSQKRAFVCSYKLISLIYKSIVRNLRGRR